MSLLSDVRDAFDADSTFSLSDPRSQKVNDLPTVIVRYGGREEGRNLCDVILLTGKIVTKDPYTEGSKDTEELVEDAVQVILDATDCPFPERFPIVALHDFKIGGSSDPQQRGGSSYVGAMIRVSD